MRHSAEIWLENNEHKANNTAYRSAHSADYFYYSNEAAAMTITSGSLSTLSSFLILLIILRSQTKVSSSYHRIMLFMSISDIFASVPITLSTLPMPSDVLYPFSTLAIGNKRTCSAQAFFIVFGQVCAVFSNVILNLYYILKFRYNKSDEFINKTIEPVGYTVSVAIGLVTACLALGYDMLNPTPYVPFCFAGPYPFDCLMDDEVECIAGKASQKEETTFKITFVACLGFAFFAVLISMVLVILSVFKTKRISKKRKEEIQEGKRKIERIALSEELQYHKHYVIPQINTSADDLASGSGQDRNLEHTDSVLKAALMYIGAYLLTWIWSIIPVLVGFKGKYIWNFLDRAKTIFNPAQGFFNLLIFVYNKVHILRKGSTKAMSLWEALRIVFIKPEEVPEFLISSLDMIDFDISKIRQERKELERINELIDRDIAEEERMHHEMIQQQDPSFKDTSSSELISIGTPSIPMSAAVSAVSSSGRELISIGTPSIPMSAAVSSMSAAVSSNRSEERELDQDLSLES